jgi:hypothetical protein
MRVRKVRPREGIIVVDRSESSGSSIIKEDTWRAIGISLTRDSEKSKAE